jgi:integrase/recombinase XerD
MQRLQPTRTLPTCPQLRRFAFLSPQNQRVIADYLTHLRTRHYALSTQAGALGALKCFTVLMPEARQATLYQDLTQTTPGDIDAWIAAAFQQGLAPGTIVTCRRGLQGFFVFLCDQGILAQSPIQLPRHQILVPTRLPHPMAETEVVAFFRVIDRLEDRTMFLLMLRCGLRVSEVSGVRWSAIDVGQGTLRGDNSKGQADRVVYLSPEVATALLQWHGLQAAATGYVFPSPMTRQRGLPLGARQIRNRMTRYLKRAGITKRYSPHALRHYLPFLTMSCNTH